MSDAQLTAEQLAQPENFTRRFHLRAVDTDKGEFTGIAVPWEESVDIFGLWRERFERGAVEDSADAKVFWDHSEVVGKLISETTTDAGWEVTGKVSRTQRGIDALTLLADGAADGLSVHFEPLEHRVEEDGTVVFTRVRVREVSITPFPQYPSARVSHLRSEATPTPHDPTNQEESQVTDTLTREDLDSALDERLSAQHDEYERSLDARLANFTGKPAGPTQLQWRSAGEYIKAIANGDTAALEFHEKWNDRSIEGDAFRRAYTGGTSGDGPARTTWVGDAIKLVNKQRKVINRFQQKPLPAEGMTLEYAKVNTNTVVVGKQAAEGDDLPKGKVTVNTATAPVETYGGWSELSLQEVKRSNVDMVNTTHQAQEFEYARQTEAAVRTYLIAQIAAAQGGTNFVPVGATPDLFAYLDGIVDAAELFEDRGFTIDGAYASKATFKTLYRLADASNRMVFNVWGSGTNLVGELSVKGLNGDLAGVRVELLAGAATKTFTFYDEVALTTWESPGSPFQLQDENIINLSKQFSVYGEIAYGTQYPLALLPFKFA